MAATVVKDSQLRLDPIISQDPKVENSAPSWVLRDTDETLPDGLYRIFTDANALHLQKNTAVGGDFGSIISFLTYDFSSLEVQFTDKIRVLGDGQIALTTSDAGVVFSGSRAGAHTVNNILYRRTSGNLHFRDGTSTEHRILFDDDVVVRETPSGALNGVNVTFVLFDLPVVGTEEVYLNGLLQDEGGSDDYTISGATITFNVAPISTDKLLVSSIKQ